MKRLQTPQQQLWKLTTEPQHWVLRQVFRLLKKRDQEDLCYGMVAYIRFGMRRPYECPFKQALFDFLAGVLGSGNRQTNFINS